MAVTNLAVTHTLTLGRNQVPSGSCQHTYKWHAVPTHLFLAVTKHFHSAFTDTLIPDSNQHIAYTNTLTPYSNLNTHFTVTNGATHGSNAFTIGSNQHTYTWL